MRKITTYDGQTIYRNIPEDYTDFKLSVNLVFIDGKTGEKLHEEALDNKNTVLRGRMDDLSVPAVVRQMTLSPSQTRTRLFSSTLHSPLSRASG